MNAVDFEYDGQYLSDYGFIICDFHGSSGVDDVTLGSVLTFNKVSRNYGKSFSLTSTRYNECITTSFDICKNPDIFDNDMEISNYDIRTLTRWLNRKKFLKFQAFDPDVDLDTCYYMASFNVEKIKLHEKVYGLHLTMETDRPFGYGETQYFKWTISSTNTQIKFYDTQDEIGFVYPEIKITCTRNGNIEIFNSLFQSRMIINHCINGEVITINGDYQVITSSNQSHDLSNDFNFEFLKIGNTYDDRENVLTVSSQCILELKYDPIIKDAP